MFYFGSMPRRGDFFWDHGPIKNAHHQSKINNNNNNNSIIIIN
jgi:hypothetical protein